MTVSAVICHLQKATEHLPVLMIAVPFMLAKTSTLVRLSMQTRLMQSLLFLYIVVERT